MKHAVSLLLSVFLLVLASASAQAEKFVEDDNYVVHYSAFNSTLIKPEVAKAYDLMRSRQRAIMNVSVQKKMPDGSRKPVMAQLGGYTGALGGSERRLDFKMITEGDAIYYLAQFMIGDGENLNFDLKIKPTPESMPIPVSFSQQFFQD